MKILVTGAAGFIGYHVCKQLINQGHKVVGLDNLNDYYDVYLKKNRLLQLGIQEEADSTVKKWIKSQVHPNFTFIRLTLEDRKRLPKLFKKGKFDVVCNLAAQAGVRYSLEHPETYVDSNIVGFLNILECCRHNHIQHLVYASSSSVYGANTKMPFATDQRTDHPISLYAATKKSNELMAYTYSHLYGLRTTGLRFFTVYGPWGRPDMAIYLFTKAIAEGKPIKVFNNGEMERDFTYIDDIVEGITRVMLTDTPTKHTYKLYNIGNGKAVKLQDFISQIEVALNKKAIKKLLPMQPGDVKKTWADTTALQKDYHYKPNTSIEQGITAFVQWYKNYHNQ
ncbi:NAD-dependent epimerase [Maribacter sp. CXY002]|uniref:NAD-dependent epimerase n=1 Tax=Maribacter luteocoastalis TaxID=3407671 RepID=UPI003B681930